MYAYSFFNRPCAYQGTSRAHPLNEHAIYSGPGTKQSQCACVRYTLDRQRSDRGFAWARVPPSILDRAVNVLTARGGASACFASPCQRRTGSRFSVPSEVKNELRYTLLSTTNDKCCKLVRKRHAPFLLSRVGGGISRILLAKT